MGRMKGMNGSKIATEGKKETCREMAEEKKWGMKEKRKTGKRKEEGRVDD